MTLLLNGDCLDEMKGLEADSIDLIFCDLPYGQTNCKWDSKIDLDKFWIEIMRIKKLNTPIFMTTTTKFGVELINSSPKKCPFRYDIVWVKSAPAGFLLAKKMPMRKHEMIYVFYEKLPFYDLTSHTHKIVKTKPRPNEDLYGMKGHADGKEGKYDPPLPVSVIKGIDNTYNTEGRKKPLVREEAGKYDPPLPVSILTEETGGATGKEKYERKNSIYPNRSKKGETATTYDPPLPNSMLEIKSTRGKHPTEKPVALMEWILKYYSKVGDVVLDPTMGSGSTGVACKNMNRNFIGIEKDLEFYKESCLRLE